MSEEAPTNDLKSGPFSVLFKAVKGNTQVLVNVRNNHKLLGRVKADALAWWLIGVRGSCAHYPETVHQAFLDDGDNWCLCTQGDVCTTLTWPT
eukprot:scaffold1208_cov239-Alexandrium_tamarense.AAC.5